jgi:hypothetical protein
MSTKRTINYLPPQLIEYKKITTYDVGNPGPGLGKGQKCGGVLPINGIPILPLLIIGISINYKYM